MAHGTADNFESVSDFWSGLCENVFTVWVFLIPVIQKDKFSFTVNDKMYFI